MSRPSAARPSAARPSAVLAGVLLAIGASLLLAAFAPFLPGGSRLISGGLVDLRHAGPIGAGLLLLVAGTALAANLAHGTAAGARSEATAMATAAALAAAAMGLLAGVAAGPALWSAAPTDELPRLLLIGSAGSLLVVPAGSWLIMRRATPSAAEAGGEPATQQPLLGWEAIGLLGVLAAFAAIVVLGMAQSPPFSWDESVYAITTRHWVAGGPSTGWGVHRPPVLSALGAIPFVFGTAEAYFRVVSLAFAIGVVGAAWWLARSIAGPWAGLTAALFVAAAPTIQIDAGLFLNDLPAAGLLMLLMAMAWNQLQRPGPIGWGLLWLAPIGALAFYLRYGSILGLAAIGLAAALIWPARLAAAWPRVAATGALFVLLLLPHAIFAVAQTGSPLGIFGVAQSGASGAYLGAGLVQYLAWLPDGLVGVVAGGVAVIGLAGATARLVVAARRRAWDPASRAAAFLLAPAMILIGLLGAFQLPQFRYLFPAMMMLVVAGSLTIVELARSHGLLGRVMRLGLAVVAAAALIGSAVTMPARSDARGAVYEWLRDAGTWIRDAAPGSCSILASDVPQLTWYSGCATYNFADTSRSGRDALLTGERRYLVLRRDGRFQPSGEVLADYLSLVDPQPVATFTNRNGIVVGSVFRFSGH